MKIKPLNALLFIVALAFFIYAFFFIDDKKPVRHLPHYGERGMHSTDTVYHTIPSFSFTNQDGKITTEKEFEDVIYVADFFFTTCRSICPVMSSQMERIANAFKDNKEVKILSHTVDPETDSVPQLKQYALNHNANSSQWLFVTGDKKELYDIARTGYLLDAHQGDGGPNDFIHTQNFALIDKEKRIRGFYDGTNTKEVDRLIEDIHLLFNEYHHK